MEIMLQFNNLHKARKVSKEQRNEDIKNPSLHLKQNSRHLQDGKIDIMVTKLWNVDIMQGNIVKYFITP